MMKIILIWEVFMANLKTTLTGYATYRGKQGHWSFLLHRITGLGTLLFLAIHIVDTSFVYFLPHLYDDVLNVYRSTFFGLAEIALVFCVLFHGANGLRIAYVDMFAKKAWTIPAQRRATLWTLIVTLIIWIPATVIMLRNLCIHNFMQ
jgi:succinate dehydrogenase / fumarate reductase cytochrome b subunit